MAGTGLSTTNGTCRGRGIADKRRFKGRQGRQAIFMSKVSYPKRQSGVLHEMGEGHQRGETNENLLHGKKKEFCPLSENDQRR